MKQFLVLLVIAVLGVACNKGGGGAGADVSLKTDEDKTFYAVGAMFGSRLQNLGLSESEVETIAAGLKDSAAGKKSKVDLAQYQSKVQELFKSRMTAKSGENKKSGVAFLEKFVSSEGGKKTESGLAYKILKEGKGKKPKATDTVEVHYHGTLSDGTVFDSSVERGKKVSFPLNRVIKGWTEGLQLLNEGGKIKLVIPSELAYGDHGAPPKIPGGSTLVFEVELFSINAKAEEKPEAAKK